MCLLVWVYTPRITCGKQRRTCRNCTTQCWINRRLSGLGTSSFTAEPPHQPSKPKPFLLLSIVCIVHCIVLILTSINYIQSLFCLLMEWPTESGLMELWLSQTLCSWGWSWISDPPASLSKCGQHRPVPSCLTSKSILKDFNDILINLGGKLLPHPHHFLSLIE